MYSVLGKILNFFTVLYGTQYHECPCDSRTLCTPIQTVPSQEMYTWLVDHDEKQWSQYDWKYITTLSTFLVPSVKLVCKAHKEGVRITLAGAPKKEILLSDEKTDQWIAEMLEKVQNNLMDGINIDFEEALGRSNKSEQNAFNNFLRKTYEKFKRANKHYQVTIDVAAVPEGFNNGGRYYNVTVMAKYSDFIIIMDYDEFLQAKPCGAYPNAPIFKTKYGAEEYIKLGAAPEKLVLALPWYGYDYICLNGTKVDETGFCSIAEEKNRCKHSSAVQVNYKDILNVKNYNPTVANFRFDNISKSPSFTYSKKTENHVIRYDNPKSLDYKVQVAKELGLRGVGSWEASSLNYSSDTMKEINERMWQTLKYK